MYMYNQEPIMMLTGKCKSTLTLSVQRHYGLLVQQTTNKFYMCCKTQPQSTYEACGKLVAAQ